jgi:hypothetical protein
MCIFVSRRRVSACPCVSVVDVRDRKCRWKLSLSMASCRTCCVPSGRGSLYCVYRGRRGETPLAPGCYITCLRHRSGAQTLPRLVAVLAATTAPGCELTQSLLLNIADIQPRREIEGFQQPDSRRGPQHRNDMPLPGRLVTTPNPTRTCVSPRPTLVRSQRRRLNRIRRNRILLVLA